MDEGGGKSHTETKVQSCLDPVKPEECPSAVIKPRRDIPMPIWRIRDYSA